MQKQLQSGANLEDINVDFRLYILKPLHTQWLVNVYNYFTSDKGKDVIAKGWKRAEISDYSMRLHNYRQKILLKLSMSELA